jgi:hypothetical protein
VRHCFDHIRNNCPKTFVDAQWKISGKKLTNIHTGHGFVFGKQKVEFFTLMTTYDLKCFSDIVVKFPQKINISNGVFTIELDKDTGYYITEHLLR